MILWDLRRFDRKSIIEEKTSPLEGGRTPSRTLPKASLVANSKERN